MTGNWSALTPRGRGFLTAGLAAAICGIVLGERDLVAIGLVLGLLPVLAGMWLFTSDVEIDVTRSVSRHQVETGHPVDVELRITGSGSRARRALLRESVPYALGSSPRFTVDALSGRPVVASYSVRTEMRGRHAVGPTTVTTTDPFGFLARHRKLTDTTRIVVTPRPDPLSGAPVTLGDGHSAGEFHPRSFIGGDATDVTIRDYRRGDDLRRVHWPSTAHAGELMVRREERPRQTACTLLVDNRLSAHRGSGSRSSLEYAIRATASIALHLIAHGCRIHAYDATGLPLLDEGHEEQPGTAAEAILTALALLPAADQQHLGDDWARHSDGSFVIAVLGALDDHDRSLLGRVGRHAGDRLALALDTGSWGEASDPDPGSDPAGRLRPSGWRAVSLRSETRIADAWQALGP